MTCKHAVKLGPEQLDTFRCLQKRFLANEPKKFKVVSRERPVLVYTDGSYEESEASPAKVGGVLLDGRKVRAFGASAPDTLLAYWRSCGKTHLKGQVEFYAVLVARHLWRERLYATGVCCCS